QTSDARGRRGVPRATTTFVRALGGAAAAAILGAVFAARAGTSNTNGAVTQLAPGARADVIDGVQSVFVVAAPIAALALLVVLFLHEDPLQGPGPARPERGAATAGAR